MATDEDDKQGLSQSFAGIEYMRVKAKHLDFADQISRSDVVHSQI